MAKIQVFISEVFYDNLKNLVEEQRINGASRSEANISNLSNKLLELGYRVYTAKEKIKENPFNEMAYKEKLYENTIKTKMIIQSIFISMFGDSPATQKKVEEIVNKTNKEVNEMFHHLEDEESDNDENNYDFN